MIETKYNSWKSILGTLFAFFIMVLFPVLISIAYGVFRGIFCLLCVFLFGYFKSLVYKGKNNLQ
jgi:xanthine/uracil/vitamin C permease (AzgA family)